jgi:hypothetical protein
VRLLMEAELGVPVVQHDDGSGPAMHDLAVVYSDRQSAAAEVTSAVDAEQTELWNLMYGNGQWVEDDLAGGWGVTVSPNARQLRRDLPPFLRSLEDAGIRSFPGLEPMAHLPVPPRGVVRAQQSDTDRPGSIYV